MKHFLTALFLLITLSMEKAGTCTAFCLNKQGSVLFCKNLDWPIGDGFIISSLNGIPKVAFVNPGETPMSWISKYRSLT